MIGCGGAWGLDLFSGLDLGMTVLLAALVVSLFFLASPVPFSMLGLFFVSLSLLWGPWWLGWVVDGVPGLCWGRLGCYCADPLGCWVCGWTSFPEVLMLIST